MKPTVARNSHGHRGPREKLAQFGGRVDLKKVIPGRSVQKAGEPCANVSLRCGIGKKAQLVRPCSKSRAPVGDPADDHLDSVGKMYLRPALDFPGFGLGLVQPLLHLGSTFGLGFL